jgi:uncharacterized Tic20 family protein
VRTIQRIENGEVDPRAYTLQSIAVALEVDFQVLAASDADVAQHQDSKQNDRWLPMLHLSGVLLLILPPIILWIWKKDTIANIREHAIDVVNFQLSMSLYLIPWVAVSAYPIAIVVFLFSQIVIIMNTVKVVSNQPYKYPLTIRFLKR